MKRTHPLFQYTASMTSCTVENRTQQETGKADDHLCMLSPVKRQAGSYLTPELRVVVDTKLGYSQIIRRLIC